MKKILNFFETKFLQKNTSFAGRRFPVTAHHGGVHDALFLLEDSVSFSDGILCFEISEGITSGVPGIVIRIG